MRTRPGSARNKIKSAEESSSQRLMFGLARFALLEAHGLSGSLRRIAGSRALCRSLRHQFRYRIARWGPMFT